MAAAFIQETEAGGTGTATTSQPVTFSSGNTGNNGLFAFCFQASTSAAFSLTDTAGNVWVPAAPAFTDGAVATVQWFYVPACIAGANTVTLTSTVSAAYLSIVITEYSGLAVVLPLDVTASAGGTGNISIGPVTTTQAGLILAGAASGGGITADAAGWTGRAPSAGLPGVGAVEELITVAGGSNTATFTATGAYAAQVVAFKGTNRISALSLLGVG